MSDPWLRFKTRPHIQTATLPKNGGCGADCHHKHEVVRLKSRLQDSLKDTQHFMGESNKIMNDLKDQYESSTTILEEEISALKEKISLLEKKNGELLVMNESTLNELDTKLALTEQKINEVEKKESEVKPTVFDRLYKDGKRKGTMTSKK